MEGLPSGAELLPGVVGGLFDLAAEVVDDGLQFALERGLEAHRDHHDDRENQDVFRGRLPTLVPPKCSQLFLQKVHTLNPMILQPEDALRMACRGGAKSFGMPSIGALTVGRKADLVLVDLQSVFVAPVHRVPSALVFNVTPRDVRLVLVDGEVRMRDGFCIDEKTGLVVDERALLAQAADAARTLFDRINLKTGLHARI